MSLPRIVTIPPGCEHQEISDHQARRHDHRSKLLELLDVHPCIVSLSPSRGAPSFVDALGFSLV